MKSLCGVADIFVLGVGFDAPGLGFDCFHVSFRDGIEVVLGSHGDLGADGLFEIVVQPFVGVEIGRIAWQVKHLDALFAFSEAPPASRDQVCEHLYYSCAEGTMCDKHRPEKMILLMSGLERFPNAVNHFGIPESATI